MSEVKQYLDGYLPQIQELAHRLRVDTDWWDFAGNYHEVEQHTLMQVLDALGFPIHQESDISAAHDTLFREYWLQVVPRGMVVRQSTDTEIPIHVPHGSEVTVELHTETGQTHQLHQINKWVNPVEIDGSTWGEATFVLPAGTELGYHQITAHTEQGNYSQEIAVVPDKLNNKIIENSRYWGVMAQLYSLSSRKSWGMGDLADLESLTRIFSNLGADFILTNPLYAGEPSIPVTPSPYLPVTRRFLSPLYIRPDNIPEIADLDSTQEAKIKVAFAQATNEIMLADREKQIDRDRSWKAKKESLRIIYTIPRTRAREKKFEQFKETQGQALKDFALWCVIYDQKGQGPWETQLCNINSEHVNKIREESTEEIDFYCWLQWIASTQMHQAQHSAKQHGMNIGIMNDLAVGVHKYGSDVWSNPDAYVKTMTVGAPPDMYNQLGQDWSQPPLNPRYLETHDWEPLRSIIRSALSNCGALRIDHLMGLLRLWWIPQGNTPNTGTYVRYNHEATVGILLLEATRANTIIVGEDLGTVEDWVRNYMAQRGILGTSVLWFEKNGNQFRHPQEYREMCMAAVNTHDLPPTLGFLRATHLTVQEKLGILPVNFTQAQDNLHQEISSLIEFLYNQGLLANNEPTEWELILGMHRFISDTPAKLLVMSLVDAVGDVRMQNQPGTNNEYPNWRIPLADSLGRPIKIEELEYYVGVKELCECMRQAVLKEPEE